MGYDAGYIYPNYSILFRALEAHFRAKGISSQFRIDGHVSKWIRDKGHVMPPQANRAGVK